MTASFTEGKHAGEFIISEANGTLSRETITVASGQKLVDGQLIQLSSGKAIAKDANLTTAGAYTTAIEGIILGNWDASATGTNADIPGVPYFKRLAEVKIAALTFPVGTGRQAEALVELAAKNIVGR